MFRQKRFVKNANPQCLRGFRVENKFAETIFLMSGTW
jgi:hypothetical protein